MLNEQDAWRSALAAGAVTAYLRGGQLHLQSSRAIAVPVSGTTVGSQYDGVVRSGRVTVPATTLVVLALG